MKRISLALITAHILFLFPLYGIHTGLNNSLPENNLSVSISRTDWINIRSAEELYSAYPERVKAMLGSFDLNKDGLERVKQAYETNNIIDACNYLLDYYRESDIRRIVHREPPTASGKTVPSADSVMQDIITVQRVTDRIPRLANGHLDWHHKGPANDNEYAWLFNRHSDVGRLLRAWYDTGNPKYAQHIDLFIKDWIISSWPYPAVRSSTSMWRGLEVTARVRMWMPVFFNLMDTGFLSPATQLLILSSLPEHTHYLRNFHAGGNWLTMEMNGLATVATSWPELTGADEWLEYSINRMTESMKSQVYPDGVQTELTSHYHHVALSNFMAFRNVVRRVGLEMPEFYSATIEDMWNYSASSMRPDGHGPLNNNSDLTYNRNGILTAASAFNRYDWEYIATNRLSGKEPENGPSFVFPWAGQLISRNGYDTDAHWSFFDIGPWGSSHQHNDKLHLSVSAFGRDLLVDAGRFAYVGTVADKFRPYALSSHSHNLIIPDGRGQGPGTRVTQEPIPENSWLITDGFDFATSSFDNYAGLEGEFKHTRSLFYVRDEFWIVVDHITTDRPRKIDALWHWHPSCTVSGSGNNIVSTANQRGNLMIIPADNTNWMIEHVLGQEEPVIQGWYSREYNIYEPGYVSIYSTRGNSGSTWSWVLFPFETDPPEVSAKVLSREPGSVKLRVSVTGRGQWDISVPFFDNSGAGMAFTR